MFDNHQIVELDRALTAIVPEGVAYASCSVSEKVAWAFEEEAAFMKKAVASRQSEFAAGRACARQALKQIGVEAGAILPDEEGVPVWPDSAHAVISHSRGICSAVAALRSDYRAIGLDLEKMNRLSPAAMKRVVHPDKAGFVGEDQVKASIVFSLKEAFYKAQYLVWRTTANFSDLALNVDMETGSARIRSIDTRFPEELRQLSESMVFRFGFFDDYVVSLCWIPNKW